MSTYDRDFCPRYHHAVELIGRRWAGVILRELLRGATRFGEISAGIPDLTDKLLAERLKVFVAEGLVERRVIAEILFLIESAPTEKGRDLEQVVREISVWAERWLPVPEGG